MFYTCEVPFGRFSQAPYKSDTAGSQPHGEATPKLMLVRQKNLQLPIRPFGSIGNLF
jgi:hypothetical protein